MLAPRSGIKPNTRPLVKRPALAGLAAAVVLTAAIAGFHAVHAEELPPVPSESPADAPSAQPSDAPSPEETDDSGLPDDLDSLPDIVAKTFEVTVSRRSTSNQVYLLDDLNDGQPPVGRILLLKKGENAAMGMRVLKLYPDKKQLAVKKVKEYDGWPNLEANDSFLAVQKLSDVIPPPPTAQDKADLKELESPLPSPSPSLAQSDEAVPEAGASPNPSPSPSDEPNDDRIGLSVQEVKPLDRHHHWISAEFGELLNNTSTGGLTYYSGGGVRYGYSLFQSLFLKGPHLQDSLVLEGGVFLYKAGNGVVEANDSYTVIPLFATVRYNFVFSETISLFVYAGYLQNIAIGANNSTTTALGTAALSSSQIAGGAGFFYRIVPGWFVRADLGIDFLGGGLVLRF